MFGIKESGKSAASRMWYTWLFLYGESSMISRMEDIDGQSTGDAFLWFIRLWHLSQNGVFRSFDVSCPMLKS